VADEKAAAELRIRVADTAVKLITGPDSAEQLAALTSAPLVFNSLLGIAGLRPTLAAISAGKNIALSNKETMVTAGELVNAAARQKGVEIRPVDSEHCAIAQCLDGKRAERLILTASGGPFFGRKREELARITREDALRHPTWLMGAKITVDCATMMNKGLEVIEAARLFAMDADHIDVIIHRESIIHSMVQYPDNAVIAQMSVPDMRMCVQHALTGNQRVPGLTAPLDLAKLGKLTFFAPDRENFPLLDLAYTALRRGGIVPAVLNGANEAAVALFLADRIGFTDIFDLVAEVTGQAGEVEAPSLEQIESADRWARARAEELAKEITRRI